MSDIATCALVLYTMTAACVPEREIPNLATVLLTNAFSWEYPQLPTLPEASMAKAISTARLQKAPVKIKLIDVKIIYLFSNPVVSTIGSVGWFDEIVVLINY